ncbi:MAG: C25 family cysteine peptidase [Candidatus Cloacimonadaceae bacterium]|jgi:hypothetical protein|nr:C25 family cysteine peptidase [Candidatus Cloacimonadota bacterium]MDX9950168.1 C25 family cysteine peptidase [Candidatus Syntrophosphaera sp.]NLN84663.1 choice-of-anchor D domain-containing protein [Candidatus Cloacimonadota bacterium]
MKRMFLLISLFLALVLTLSATQITLGSQPNEIKLVESLPQRMVFELSLGHFEAQPVQIGNETWHELSLKKEGITLEEGNPQLPILARSVIIPNSARMELSILESEYQEISLAVAPSKGNLTRDIDPASVPHRFGASYQGSQPWPTQTALVSEPFILRDYRGITVHFKPFMYFPESQTLRVYTRMKVALEANGTDFTNSLPVQRNAYAAEFESIYANMFLNFREAKYPSLGEEGRILAIKHSMFDTVMDPWVQWKRENGYRVDIVDVSVAGPTANQIKTYIQNQYDLNDGLMFVQIFGDAPQVPSLSSGGGGSDPSYALLAGSDNYPDIYVGRFSAETEAQMETQVLRTVHYERDIEAGEDWVQKGMGIASNEGGGGQGDNGESDQQHMELIRTNLLNYGYLSVDQVYQAQGATAAMVSANVNDGRGFTNYVGHGSDTSWGTTGFSNTHVNALTNDYKLPFINSVACVNGNFVSRTCFAEAWLRAQNSTTGAPTGAIGMYASSVNQSWAPPMRAQDETVDLLCAESKQTLGGLFYNGSSRMIEVYGTNGASEYKNWHIFGDASLMVRSKDAEPMAVDYSPILLMGMSTFMVETVPGARVTLFGNDTLYGTGIADPSGVLVLNLVELPQEPMDLTLTITAFNKETHRATIQVLPAEGPYLIVTGMDITDDNNNIPEYGEIITLQVNLENVGSDPATQVQVMVQTEDPYLTVLGTSEALGDIAPGGTGQTSTGIDIQVANNVPDQHVAEIKIIAMAGSETYEHVRRVTLNAPAFTWASIIVEDFLGNNNGMLDPGESVTLKFPFLNSGHAQANDITTALVINGARNVSEPIVTDFMAVPPGGSGEIEYFVTFSSQIPTGSVIEMNTMLFSGEYSAHNSYSQSVGLLMEGFETNFSAFDWSFSGGNWTIEPESYDGSNAARSAAISHGQSTSMSVTLDSPQAGEISFWKKVSSEQNYDFLKFYINGQLKNQWSGTSDDWNQQIYTVPAGTHTYKWEYVKDGSASSGSDCAWIDEVVFPSYAEFVGAPEISLEAESLDFGDVFIGEEAVLPFTITNSGDAVLIGTVSVAPPFKVSQGNSIPGNFIYIVVQPESYLTVNISFKPMDQNQHNATMAVSTDDPENPELSVELSGKGQPVANDDEIAPAVTELKGNYPNPFNPSTTIAFSLKEGGAVEIGVYNLKGQLVRNLVSEHKAAGNHIAVFDGLDNHGKNLGSGVYIYRMKAGDYSKTQKMIMLK